MAESPVNLDTFLSFNVRVVLAGIVIFFVYINLQNKASGYLIVAGLIFLYIFTFISGRYYLREGFKAVEYASKPLSPREVVQDDVVLDETTRSFYDKPIDNLDDYEYSMVFQNENDREVTKELRSKLMSQYPMDWTTNPPSSKNFNNGMKKYSQNQTDVSGAVDTNVFKNIGVDNLTPPDMDKVEEEERKILKTYQPKNTKDLKTYDVDDAYTLIKKIYDAKGEIPEVLHKKDTNVYEIVGVRRKDEKVLYEDEEAPASMAPNQGAGEARIVVPPTAYDTAAAKDPYYDTMGGKGRIGKWDYQAWTPGLERMFAPTNPTEKWS
jgi:hypothetical protein